MEVLVIKAYYKAKTKEFFAITSVLERLMTKHYSLHDPRTRITTGEVKRILKSRGLELNLSGAAI